MGAPTIRILTYLAGGGLILMWLDPAQGIFRVLVILALIFSVAYFEAILSRKKKSPVDPKVVSMGAFKTQRHKQAGLQDGGREKRALKPIYESHYPEDINELLHIFREKGLHPMMVTQGGKEEQMLPLYRILIPEKELVRAKALIDLRLVQSINAPS